MDSITTTMSIASPSTASPALHFSEAAQPRCFAGIATVVVLFAAAAMSAPVATLGATAVAMAVIGACAMGRSGFAYANGRGIAPNANRSFFSISWHLTTTEKKKGHSQRERCT